MKPEKTTFLGITLSRYPEITSLEITLSRNPENNDPSE